jgi:ribosome production factor 1
MFAALFPQQPEFLGRQVVTFHNQRDFIFFRQHRYAKPPSSLWVVRVVLNARVLCCHGYRYIFKDGKRVGLQEIGPRFTLKLRSLQKGTFDSKFGEFEFVHNVCRPCWLRAPGLEAHPLSPVHPQRKQMEKSRRKFLL